MAAGVDGSTGCAAGAAETPAGLTGVDVATATDPAVEFVDAEVGGWAGAEPSITSAARGGIAAGSETATGVSDDTTRPP